MSPRPLDWERMKRLVPEVPRIVSTFGPLDLTMPVRPTTADWLAWRLAEAGTLERPFGLNLEAATAKPVRCSRTPNELTNGWGAHEADA